jgi:hypothetical protein
MNISKERLLEIEAELSTLTIKKIAAGENIRICHALCARDRESWIAEMLPKVKEAISKCNSMNDLNGEYYWAKRWCWRYGYRSDLYNHLLSKPGKLDMNEVKDVFDNWKGTLNEFRKVNSNLISYAKRKGMYFEWTKHFTRTIKRVKYADKLQ